MKFSSKPNANVHQLPHSPILKSTPFYSAFPFFQPISQLPCQNQPNSKRKFCQLPP